MGLTKGLICGIKKKTFSFAVRSVVDFFCRELILFYQELIFLILFRMVTYYHSVNTELNLTARGTIRLLEYFAETQGKSSLEIINEGRAFKCNT